MGNDFSGVKGRWSHSLRILVYFVIYDSGKMSLEHLLLSRYPNSLSQPTLSLSSYLKCNRNELEMFPMVGVGRDKWGRTPLFWTVLNAHADAGKTSSSS